MIEKDSKKIATKEKKIVISSSRNKNIIYGESRKIPARAGRRATSKTEDPNRLNYETVLTLNPSEVLKNHATDGDCNKKLIIKSFVAISS